MAGIPFALDTDMGTDVDDALALAFALRHPQLDLRAVTTVSGDTMRRARIAANLLALAGREDLEVAAGEPGEQSHATRYPEAGHEDAMLGDDPHGTVSGRGGVDLLIDVLGPGTVEVATVGMQSNLAAAVEREPSLAGRVSRLTVMGGMFSATEVLGRRVGPAVDHNLNVDQTASLRALNAGFRTLYVPCEVTMHAWLLARHVDRLRKGDALCRELARQVDIWRELIARGYRGRLPIEYMCQLHDPLAVACMVDRSFVRIEHLSVSVAMHGGLARTFIDPAGGIEAEVVRSVDAAGFAEFWLETVLR